MIAHLENVTSAEDLADRVNRFINRHPTCLLKKSGVIVCALENVTVLVCVSFGRCSLHCWSDSLNLFRTIVKAEEVKQCLRITLSRFGHKNGECFWLEPSYAVTPLRERPSIDAEYSRLLASSLERWFIDHYPAQFGPRVRIICVQKRRPHIRGVISTSRGRLAFIGAGPHENSTSVNGLVRAGILWLTACRESVKHGHIVGLVIVCPYGRAQRVQARLRWIAGFAVELYEFEDDSRDLRRLTEVCSIDRNLDIAPTFNNEKALERCIRGIAELLSLLPRGAATRIDVQPVSPTRVSVRLNGLELAVIKYKIDENEFSYKPRAHLYSGLRRKPILLTTPSARHSFQTDMLRVFSERLPGGSCTGGYYRIGPDAWLTKRVRQELVFIEPSIDMSAVYRDVAITCQDYADSVDLLGVSRTGQLLIFHIRANENQVFPMHGLDQWSNIRELNLTGALKKAGYFPGIDVSREHPRLIFVTPALRLHGQSLTVLSHICKEVKWTFIGVSERWRERCAVIYRYRDSHG